MAKSQVYKKRGKGPGKTDESTFEQGEKTEIPEIDGVMDQIETNLNKTANIVVKPKKKKKKKKKAVAKKAVVKQKRQPRRSGCCWS